jgi:hypothetical protein
MMGMIYIKIEWKVLFKFLLAWFILWPWFIYCRFIKIEKDPGYLNCKCGVGLALDNHDWYGWRKWRNFLYTATDIYAYGGEYPGAAWNSHSICWRCGRYSKFSDSSS